MKAREKAWKSRREKYGPKGHHGTYSRASGKCCDHCNRMRVVIVGLHREGVLSEGQAARISGLSRVEVRAWLEWTKWSGWDKARYSQVHAVHEVVK